MARTPPRYFLLLKFKNRKAGKKMTPAELEIINLYRNAADKPAFLAYAYALIASALEDQAREEEPAKVS